VVVNHNVVGGRYQLTLADNLFLTTKRTVNTTFDWNTDTEAGVVSELFKTLINDYTGLTADDTSVQNSGATIILKEFRCKADTVFNCIKRLADAIGWQFYYNPITDKVHFEPVGFEITSSILRTGVNIRKVPSWKVDSLSLVNYVELRGAVQEVRTDVNGRIGTTAGFTTSEIAMPEIPSSVKVFCDASNPPTTIRTGGNVSIETYDYEVHQDPKEIEWNNDQYTPGASDYVYVDLGYYVPVPVVVEDADSIKIYSDDDPEKIKKKVLKKPEITNREDAEQYAQQYLNDFKAPIVTSSIDVTNISGLRVGQRIQVIDDWNPEYTNSYQITSVKMSSPYSGDRVTIASVVVDEDLYAFNILQRMNRLEEENLGDSDIILFVKNLVRPGKVKRWYSKMEKRTQAATTGIYGHARYGIYGTSQYAPATLPSYADDYIIPGNNEYREFFRSDAFDGTGTATWNTTTNELTFTSGQTRTTDNLALGISYDYFTVTLGSMTGSVLVEITGDGGSTWQTVTLNTRTAFSSSDGTGTKLRFTENAASTATIKPSEDGFGTFDDPGLKCTLEE